MKLKLLVSGIFVLLHCFSSLGQNFTNDDQWSADRTQEILREIALPQTGKEISPFVSNNVYIAQVGEGNATYVNISAKESSLDINQEGGYNTVSIEANVRSVEGTIIQNGNNNFALNLASDTNLDVPINIRQDGNGLNFESYGVNSIGSKLKFEMTGDANSIIVRNFK